MTGVATINRRERKKETTRHAIEDAAWALFAEQGYNATTIEDITERADVAPRTFFRYFPSKEAVLFGDPRAHNEELRASLGTRPVDESAFEALRAALRATIAVVAVDRHRHLLRHRILSEYGGRKIEDHFGALAAKSAVIAEAIAERLGTTAEDPRARLLAGAALTVVDVAYAQWIAGGATQDLVTILDATFDTFTALTGSVGSPSSPRGTAHGE